MEEWVNLIVHYLAIIMEVCVVLVTAYGAVRTVYAYLRKEIRRDPEEHMSEVWLLFARHLALGLEFALAADVLRTIIAFTWEKIGLLIAIAMLRAFLSFFLDREMETMKRSEECTQ